MNLKGQDKTCLVFVVTLSSMPTGHQARFSLTIEDSEGRIFTESFYLTEGDYLPGFIVSDEIKQSICKSVNNGETVYLPALTYPDKALA
jgi:hypothetical protein